MNSYKNNQDGLCLIKYPTTVNEWEKSPLQEIEILMPAGKEPLIGDRIYIRTEMLTSGMKSGGMADIYYYIKGGIKKNEETGIYTAMASRVEI